MALKQKYCKKNCGQKQLSLPTDELHSSEKKYHNQIYKNNE